MAGWMRRRRQKISMLMNTGQGLAIEKNLAKFDVKVLAAETRKQVSCCWWWRWWRWWWWWW